MKQINSKEDLRSIYKAVIRSLIVFHDFKHAHVAAILEMRQDTFSKWFCSNNRSLASEEVKLFCEGLSIPTACIDALVNIIIEIKKSNIPLTSQLSTLVKSKDSSLLRSCFSEDEYFKVLLTILNDLSFIDQITLSSLAS